MTVPTASDKNRLRAVGGPLLNIAMRQGMYLLDSVNEVWEFTNAGTPTDGTSGTGAGVTGPGSICIDTTNTLHYINTGTLASPTWTKTGAQT